MRRSLYKKIIIFLSCLFSGIFSVACSSTSNNSNRDLIKPTNIQVANDIWNGEIDETWFNKEEATYHINTAQQFAGLANLVNTGYSSFINKKIIVDSDLHLNVIADYSTNVPSNIWTPIGFNGYSFRGVIDFAGHTVDGMYINNSVAESKTINDSIGLFGVVELKTPDSPIYISNLQLFNSFIDISEEEQGITNVGSVVGKILNGGTLGKMNGLINVVSDCNIKSQSKSLKFIGGISGYTQANIFNCGYTGSFYLVDSAAKVGGIAAGGAFPCYVVNSYSTTDLAISNIRAVQSGVISYQCLPICSYYQKNGKYNRERYAFGYIRRMETDDRYLPYGNGIFSSIDDEVIISDAPNRYNGDSGWYGDNGRKIEAESYENLLSALNSFSFSNNFTNNANDDLLLKKWIIDSEINHGYPINVFGE